MRGLALLINWGSSNKNNYIQSRKKTLREVKWLENRTIFIIMQCWKQIISVPETNHKEHCFGLLVEF